MTACTFCNRNIPEDSLICPYCGKKLPKEFFEQVEIERIQREQEEIEMALLMYAVG